MRQTPPFSCGDISKLGTNHCLSNGDLLRRWAEAEDFQLGSASDSDESGQSLELSPDIEAIWENFDETFDTKPAAAAAPRSGASPEPLQITLNLAARLPPLQILDPKTLALTGPKSPFLGQKHSQENETWHGFALQSPSEMGDEDLSVGGREAADAPDAAASADDPNAGMEYLDLNASHDCVAQ